MGALRIRSYAKINLGLYLLKKRLDGYHDILTVFQAIDLYDTLTIRRNDSYDMTIRAEGISIPQNEDNLVYRAFRIFQKKMHRDDCGIEVHIRKRIPVGGGLGGGSSNAAATLVALNRLWETRLSIAELEAMAAEIGSDVPFFIKGGTAIGEGRGENLTPVDISREYWVFLVCPDISISTAWAYSQAKIRLTKDENLTKFRSLFQKLSIHSLRDSMQNELEGVVFQRHPLLRLIKNEMYKWDAFYASMSGSGSSVYGLFQHREQAEAVQSFFSIDGKATTFLCRPISSTVPEPLTEAVFNFKN